MLYLNFRAMLFRPAFAHLTLTNVVFEFLWCILSFIVRVNLTLTNVVFELPIKDKYDYIIIDLTLTNVVFEYSTAIY